MNGALRLELLKVIEKLNETVVPSCGATLDEDEALIILGEYRNSLVYDEDQE